MKIKVEDIEYDIKDRVGWEGQMENMYIVENGGQSALIEHVLLNYVISPKITKQMLVDAPDDKMEHYLALAQLTMEKCKTVNSKRIEELKKKAIIR